MTTPKLTPEQKRFEFLMRFMSKVDVSGECWEWQAGKTRSGYGQFKLDGRMQRAHRVAYEIFNGPIAEGMSALHSCHKPSCVNPEHLRQGTQADNMRDMFDANRQAPPKGEKHWKSKLNEEAVKVIRHMYPEKTLRQLADAYGVSQMNISLIVNRKIWSHV